MPAPATTSRTLLHLRDLPGPRGRKMVPLARQLLYDVIPALTHLHVEWGDRVSIPVPTAPIIALFAPDDVRRVLIDHRDVFGKGPIVARLAKLSGANLFQLEGDAHATRRAAANPCFRPRDIEAYVGWSVAAAAGCARELTAGSSVDLLATTERMLIDSIGQSLVGAGMGDSGDDFGREMHDGYALMPTVLRPAWPLLAHLPFGPARRARHTKNAMYALMSKVVAAAEVDESDTPTLLRALVTTRNADGTPALTEQQVIEELIGFTIAGHETTAAALVWVLAELSSNPLWRDRMVEEHRAVVGDDPLVRTHLAQLPVTRAIIDETLRLWGSAFTLRYALEDVELDDLVIRKGTSVFIGSWCIHRDARWWPEPAAFRPDRFLDAGASAARHKYAYLPWGGGHRRCLGQHLAMQIMLTTLVEFHRDFWFELDTSDSADGGVSFPTPEAQISVRPTGVTSFVVHSRTSIT